MENKRDEEEEWAIELTCSVIFSWGDREFFVVGFCTVHPHKKNE